MLSSCMTFKQIGNLTMMSNRNIDSKMDDYVVVRSYMGDNKKELKKSKSTTIEDAIDQTVRNTPGGEFLKNVKVYVVNSKYIAVAGDVWGHGGVKADVRGFKVGDTIQYMGAKYTITDLKDGVNCVVKSESGKLIKVKYTKMMKAD
jgi:hypothetical protein